LSPCIEIAWIAPLRTCVSIAGSFPRTLFPKIAISRRPFVSRLTAWLISTSRTCIGWFSAMSWPHLKENSAAEARLRAKAIEANAALEDVRNARRV
jgi:hypothetical protein